MRPFDPVPFPEKYYSFLQEPGTILLQTSRVDRHNGRSLLFCRPIDTIVVRSAQEFSELFPLIEEALRAGRYIAGYISYEAGSCFHRKTRSPEINGNRVLPLAYFHVYSEVFLFDHLKGEFIGAPLAEPDQPKHVEGFSITDLEFSVGFDSYAERIERIKEWIRSGDTYQVNLTDKFRFNFSGSPIAFYRELLGQQGVSYGAFLNLGELQILSFSPELFFHKKGRSIRTRPMKGTIRRGLDIEEDAALAQALQLDEKNRSENLMIVDLLRNDLGRISEFGSVAVEELFSVERYETLFQMTSTVSAKLLESVGYEEIFRSLFPCGSITGAPKLRTMQIIEELESEPRGVYTGAIGFFAPGGEAMFNVAIRTISLHGAEGEMGVGGGIVYDSIAEQEYKECLLKGSFLTERQPAFQLVETMRWSGEYERLALHLKRLRASAEYFDFSFHEEGVRQRLLEEATNFSSTMSYRVRLLQDKSGGIQITSSPIDREDKLWRVAISSKRTASTDRFLRHKTTNRSLYESQRQRAVERGFDDLIFLNEREEVTEGAITNIFVETGEKLCTPPVSCGLLPGVYREYLLQSNPEMEERILSLRDLRTAKLVYLCNSVRGLRKAEIHFDVVI